MLSTVLSVALLSCVSLIGAQIVPDNATIDSSNTAVKIQVASSGGNATSPYQYGIMFEVRRPFRYWILELTLTLPGYQPLR